MVYEQQYDCRLCAGEVVILTDKYMEPLGTKLLTHRDITHHEQLVEIGYKFDKVIGINLNCWGSLKHKGTKEYVPPKFQDVFSKSTDYCKGQQKETTNTICAAVDMTADSNLAAKGVNKHGLTFGKLHHALQAKLGNAERLEAWNTTNCAEIEAVHKLLTKGVPIAMIRVYSRDKGAKVKPPCENCQGWLVSTGKDGYKIRGT